MGWEEKYMKLSRILIFIIVGAILGSTITYLVCSNNKSNPKENVNYFTESGKLILPLEEKYLVGNSGDEKLYIEFNDDYFNIKKQLNPPMGNSQRIIMPYNMN